MKDYKKQNKKSKSKKNRMNITEEENKSSTDIEETRLE